MPIEEERISHDIETIAGFNETTPDVGYSRPTFSPAWRMARDFVIEQAKAAGCKVRIDAAGNIHARPESLDWKQKIWLSGSHIDSVPTGGKYDGVIGVVCPLEILRAASQRGRVIPLELIVFAEEEGTTFGLGMLGSHAWAGTLSVDRLESVGNKDGLNFIDAGKDCGVDPRRLAIDRLDGERYLGFIEIHAEQGLSMWKSQTPIAVVEAINGRRQYAGTVTGVANHAGSTGMSDRADALAATAECVAELERVGRGMAKHAPSSVITVGQLWVKPNAINVIPGSVDFTIDFRTSSPELLKAGDSQIRAVFAAVEKRRGRRNAVPYDRVTAGGPDVERDLRQAQRSVEAGSIGGARNDHQRRPARRGNSRTAFADGHVVRRQQRRAQSQFRRVQPD